MNKSVSSLLVCVLCGTGAALSVATPASAAPKVVQVATVNPEKPVMSHEVASLMQTLQKAQAQHRRTGQAQDLARVEALRRELAQRGYGRITQSAPVMLAQPGSMLDNAGTTRVSLAD